MENKFMPTIMKISELIQNVYTNKDKDMATLFLKGK
jgi:hypothetical protein